MAEKKKKSPPKFGGKRALKDTSGDGKITFADTFLGDLLGFDGKAGTKGKAGLRKSLGGARRMKDGVETSKRPKARPTAAEKKAVVKGGRGTPPTAAQIAERSKKVNTPAAKTKKPTRNRLDDKNGKPVGIGGLNYEIDAPGAPFFKSGGRKRVKPTPRGDGPDMGPKLDPNRKRSKPLAPKKTSTAETKKNMKQITLKDWKDLTPSERVMMGLPKNNQAVFGLTGALTLGAGLFTKAFKANRGGLAKKSGYMYGGSVTKKKPLTKMSKGGMVKKK